MVQGVFALSYIPFSSVRWTMLENCKLVLWNADLWRPVGCSPIFLSLCLQRLEQQGCVFHSVDHERGNVSLVSAPDIDHSAFSVWSILGFCLVSCVLGVQCNQLFRAVQIVSCLQYRFSKISSSGCLLIEMIVSSPLFRITHAVCLLLTNIDCHCVFLFVEDSLSGITA